MPRVPAPSLFEVQTRSLKAKLVGLPAILVPVILGFVGVACVLLR